MEELSTEQKIIAAARTVFTKKGYAATRTRDIAEEAHVNLALLNYYFKSKQNLFHIVAMEKFEKIIAVMSPVMSDESVSLNEKINILIGNYMNLLAEEEDLPLFILNELKVNSEMFTSMLHGVQVQAFPVIEKQLKEAGSSLSPVHFIMNTVSLALFPYVAKSLFVSAGLFRKENFEQLMNERKEQIPEWMMKIIK